MKELTKEQIETLNKARKDYLVNNDDDVYYDSLVDIFGDDIPFDSLDYYSSSTPKQIANDYSGKTKEYEDRIKRENKPVINSSQIANAYGYEDIDKEDKDKYSKMLKFANKEALAKKKNESNEDFKIRNSIAFDKLGLDYSNPEDRRKVTEVLRIESTQSDRDKINDDHVISNTALGFFAPRYIERLKENVRRGEGNESIIPRDGEVGDLFLDTVENAAMTASSPLSAFTKIPKLGATLSRIASKTPNFVKVIPNNAAVPVLSEVADAIAYDDDDPYHRDRADFSAKDALIGTSVNLMSPLFLDNYLRRLSKITGLRGEGVSGSPVLDLKANKKKSDAIEKDSRKAYERYKTEQSSVLNKNDPDLSQVNMTDLIDANIREMEIAIEENSKALNKASSKKSRKEYEQNIIEANKRIDELKSQREDIINGKDNVIYFESPDRDKISDNYEEYLDMMKKAALSEKRAQGKPSLFNIQDKDGYVLVTPTDKLKKIHNQGDFTINGDEAKALKESSGVYDDYFNDWKLFRAIKDKPELVAHAKPFVTNKVGDRVTPVSNMFDDYLPEQKHGKENNQADFDKYVRFKNGLIANKEIEEYEKLIREKGRDFSESDFYDFISED